MPGTKWYEALGFIGRMDQPEARCDTAAGTMNAMARMPRSFYVSRSLATANASDDARLDVLEAGVLLRGRASATWDPASVAAGGTTTTTVTVTGAALGDPVIVGFSTAIATATVRLHASVTAANTVTVVLTNGSGGAVDLASGTLNVVVLKP